MIPTITKWKAFPVCLTLLSSTPLDAQQATLQGAIVDSEGAVIDTAQIVVHEDAAGKRSRATSTDTILKSDARGRFALKVAPGFYDVCVMADAFTPDCRKVFIKEGQTVSRRIRLKADPQVFRVLGDRFFR